MSDEIEGIVKQLRALVIMDEVGSDNPLGRDAADLILSLQVELEEVKERQQRVGNMIVKRQDLAALMDAVDNWREQALAAERALEEMRSARELAQTTSGAHAMGEARHADSYDEHEYDVEDDEDFDDCGLMADGQCTKAGSEECDWVCGRLR